MASNNNRLAKELKAATAKAFAVQLNVAVDEEDYIVGAGDTFSFNFDLDAKDESTEGGSDKLSKAQKKKARKKKAKLLNSQNNDSDDNNVDSVGNGNECDTSVNSISKHATTSVSVAATAPGDANTNTSSVASTKKKSKSKAKSKTKIKANEKSTSASSTSSAFDDDLDFLNQQIKEVSIHQEKLDKEKKKKEKEENHSKTTGLHMVTSKNMQFETEEKKKLLKYGNGLNLVSTMPTKVRDSNWLLGGMNIQHEPRVDTATGRDSSSDKEPSTSEYVTHSSPFGFGFQFS